MSASTAPEPLQWDLFCQVIDNYGDIGVCWRLAAQLARRGQAVRLWVDDASALAWMAPGGYPGVQLRDWHAPAPGRDEPAADVVVEAFGCTIPDAWLAGTVQRAEASGRRPVWINLEYLSAEAYVERHHRLSSLVAAGPAAGWTRWFFYPGFTPATGGLLREPDLMERLHAFDAAGWRLRHAPPDDGGRARRWTSLFCYEPPALPAFLAQCRLEPSHLLVTPGRATQAVQSALAHSEEEKGGHRTIENDRLLSISYLAPCTQSAFDHLLWACDFNAVRGEDSLVRALWAGRPFVWHIYPQDDDAHHPKLQAFLDWMDAPASLRQFHAAWNGVGSAPLVMPDDATLAQWTTCTRLARDRLLAQPDLVTQLLGFVREKR